MPHSALRRASNLRRLLVRAALILTVVFGTTAVVTTPAMAGINGEYHLGDGDSYVKLFWTWDGARRITNTRMEILDDECNATPAYGRFTVYRYGTSSASSRWNERGCGKWQTFTFGTFSYKEDIINIQLCTLNICGAYIDNPFT